MLPAGLYKFAFGHVSDYSHHLVTMVGCVWMESTVSNVTAQTQATKANCVRTTLMTVKFPHAPTALSAMMELRTTVAVAFKAMQVCKRYLGAAPLHLLTADRFSCEFPEHCGSHGMSQQMQAFCTVKLMGLGKQ